MIRVEKGINACTDFAGGRGEGRQGDIIGDYWPLGCGISLEEGR
jgi:hypothetical protein